MEKELSDLWVKYSDSLTKPTGTGKKGDKSAPLKEELSRLQNENEQLKWDKKELKKKTGPTKRLEVKVDKKDWEIEKLQI